MTASKNEYTAIVYSSPTEDSSMSLVHAMHNGNEMTIVADGLSRFFDPDSDEEQLPNVNTSKVFMLDKYVVIGYSNSKVSYDFIRGLIGAIKVIYDNNPRLQLSEIALDVSRTIQQFNVMFNSYPDGHYRILIAGFNRNEDGRPTNPNLWFINHEGLCCQSKVNYLAVGVSDISDPIFDKLSGGKDLSMQKAIELGAETLFETAKLNDYVGGQFTYWNITRERGVIGPFDLAVYNKGMSKKLFDRLIKRAS